MTHGHLSRGAASVLLIVTLVTACGGTGSSGTTGGKESASAFIQRVTTQFSRGQSERLWSELYPADQAIVSRSRYLACQGNEGFRLTGMKVLETYPESVDVAGAPEKAEAVTVQVTSDNGVTTATVHAVKAGSTWHWILSPADRAAYKQGKCP